MFPRYNGINDELAALNQKITEYKEALNRINPGDERETRMKNSLLEKLNKASNCIIIMTGNGLEQNKDTAWDEFTKLFHDSDLDGLRMMNSLSTEENRADFQRRYEREQTRKICDINEKFHLLENDAIGMVGKERYHQYYHKITKLNQDKKVYLAELKTFDEPYPYKTYNEMVNHANKAEAGYQQWKAEFERFNGIEETERTVNNLKLEHIKEQASISSDQKRINEELQNLEKALNDANEKLKKESEISAQEKERMNLQAKEKWEKNQQKREKVSAELKDLEAQAAEIEEKRKPYEQMKAEAQAKLARYEKGNKTNAKHINMLRQNQALQKLQTELKEQMNLIGYDKISSADKTLMLKEGETISNLNEKVRDDLTSTVADSAKKLGFRDNLYKIYDKVVDQYIELTDATQDEVNEIHDKARSLDALGEYLGWRVTENNLALQKMEADPKNTANFVEGQRAWMDVESAKQVDTGFDRAFQQNQEEQRNAKQALADLDADDQSVVHRMQEKHNVFDLMYNTDSVIQDYQKRIKELKEDLAFTEKRHQENQKFYKDEIEPREKEVRYARNAKEEYQKFSNERAKVLAIKNKFDQFHSKHHDLYRGCVNLRHDLRLDKNFQFTESSWTDDMTEIPGLWHSTFRNIKVEALHFASKAEWGKQPNHVNTPEFERMVNSLNAFGENASKTAPVDEYITKLAEVRKSAQDYLDAKDKQIRGIFSSNMRKIRIQYATDIVKFVDDKMKTVADELKRSDELYKQLKEANLSTILQDASKDAVLNKVVNPAVEVLRKQKENPQVQKAPEKKPDVQKKPVEKKLNGPSAIN